jgi:hypothetical protein
MRKTMLMSMSVGLLVGVGFFSSLNSARAQARRSDDVTVTGKWELVGKEGEWKNRIEIVAMDGFLWSVEKDGSLYKTDPATGKSIQVGEKGSFENLTNLEGMDHLLWSIEAGTLYKNDPKTGKWEQVGKEGEWSKTIDFVGLGGFLYSIEPDGSLWKTDKSGNNTLLDKGDFKGASHLTEMGGKLWTIEKGTLYQTDPNTLKWQQIGKDGGFSKISAMEGTTSFIWMIDKSGNLYKVDKDGTKTLLGDDYGETTILTSLNGKLWTVEGGSLYRTN